MKFIRSLLFALSVLAAIGLARAGAALKPDQIALVVNRNVPESLDLARFYAQARGIPDDRIIELDVPTSEEIPFDRYEHAVLPQVRQFLLDHGLKDQVRCLVTFYGVPLRINDRINNPAEQVEQIRLRETSKHVLSRVTEIISDIERQTAEFDPTFQPETADNSLESLIRRAQYVAQRLGALKERAAAAKDQGLFQRITQLDREATARLTSPVSATDSWPASSIEPKAPTTEPVEALIARPHDPEARNALRAITRQNRGLVGYAKLIDDQFAYFSTEATGSAFDSELALIWWPPYLRTRWQPNTMNPHFKEMRSGQTVMVMRLDAPTVQLVRDIIANSLLAERDGLAGKMAVDARGIHLQNTGGKDDAFGLFDQRLRNLAALVESKSSMPVILDDRSEVIPPSAPVEGVALYCGWYSLRRYVPALRFNRGAVGYHVASFELAGLHSPLETGWVHGLLTDGVVATVGPVAEPYLHSFPLPEEFFPLLMTGKLPLAEVYWTTTPLTSWMQTCIGDPLYTPFARNPALKVDDLPPLLRSTIP
jgi:uncharacterized protein (TIGR03790 family)